MKRLLFLLALAVVPFLSQATMWEDPWFEDAIREAGLICTGVVVTSSPQKTLVRLGTVFKGAQRNGALVTILRSEAIGVGHEADQLEEGEDFFFIVKRHRNGYVAFTDSYWAFDLNDSLVTLPIHDPAAYITIKRTQFEPFLDLLLHGGSARRTATFVAERLAELAFLQPLTKNGRELDAQLFNLEVLYYFGKAAEAVALPRFLESPYSAVRWSCVRALVTCGGEVSRAALLRQLEREEDGIVQSMLGKAIFQLRIMEARPLLEARIPLVSREYGRIAWQIMDPLSNTLPPARYSFGAALMKLEGAKGTYAGLLSKARDYIARHPRIRLHILEDKRLFSSLDEALKQPDSVYILRLDRKEMTELPREVARLKNLRSLSLVETKIKELPAFVADLGLLELNLSNSQMEAVPSVVFKCNTLEKLELNSNSIRQIPAGIGNLHHLKKLGLRMNKLDTLPDAIGELQHLEEIELYGNDFYLFPAVLTRCPALKVIYLGSNEIKRLPTEVAQMSRIKYIDVSYNEFSQLERARIAQLPAFLRVNTESYKDRYFSIFEALADSQSAVTIHDNYNDYSNLQVDLSPLKAAEFLILTYDSLRAFPRGVTSLARLKSLVLHHNRIEEVAEDIGKMSSLSRLDLSFNKLTKLPPGITQLPLKYLNLSNNDFSDTERKVIEGWFNGRCRVVW
ncbi:leucine-rich repeat domain-containing protein [Paraflavisolibacter sp. H34]|uniref:leucine-rich repeat domain-containing protein n=1 Tax=Huijunlia imazamoxiresistens TaxID=3127457 RepID=UPI0030196B7F